MALTWFTVHDLPRNTVEYPKAYQPRYLNDSDGLLTEHTWQQ